MRTPLNAILGHAEIASGEEMSTDLHHSIARINQNAQVLLGLISDLLDVSKIEAGQSDWESVEFNLAECLQQALFSSAKKARGKNLEFDFDIDPSLPRYLLGDGKRLHQIISNLAENAVKFTDNGFVRVSISDIMDSQAKGRAMGIRVTDSGIGMTPDVRARVFERVFQGDSSTTRKKGGAGLGLHIVKSLVQTAGGTIVVQDNLGVGSEFRVLIPLLGPQDQFGLPSGGMTMFRIVLPSDTAVIRRNHVPAVTETISAPRSACAASLLVPEDHDDNFDILFRYPRVDCVPAFATTIEEVVPVEDHEAEAEAGLHFALPLSYERGRTGNHDALNFLAHDHLTENEASFDSFAESDVVGDEEIDARHLERLFQRLQLVRHDLDACAVRRLEQPRIRGCYKVPAEGMQVSGENVWGVEALASEMPPVRLLKYLGGDFAFPEDGEAFTLSVVFQAGKIDKRLLPAWLPGGFDSFYQVSPAANLHNLAK